MQQYYSKFQNLSETNQRRTLAIMALFLNWLFLSWFPLNAFFIYILARGLTTNNGNNRVLDTVSTMYMELQYVWGLILRQYSKVQAYRNKNSTKIDNINNATETHNATETNNNTTDNLSNMRASKNRYNMEEELYPNTYSEKQEFIRKLY